MVKSFLKKIIIWILEIEARIVLKKYKPRIVAITGSVGKTSTKDAVFSIFSRFFNARKSKKSYNSDIGVPLAILDCESGWYSPLLWIKNILKGLGIIFGKENYPEWLILEMGVEGKGDIENLLKIVKPKVGVITFIGELPVHVEFFASPEELAREKSKLVKALGGDDFAVLNFDDDTVFSLKDEIKARVLGYG